LASGGDFVGEGRAALEEGTGGDAARQALMSIAGSPCSILTENAVAQLER